MRGYSLRDDLESKSKALGQKAVQNFFENVASAVIGHTTHANPHCKPFLLDLSPQDNDFSLRLEVHLISGRKVKFCSRASSASSSLIRL